MRSGSGVALAVVIGAFIAIAVTYSVLPPIGYWVSSKDLFSSAVVVFSLLFTTLITVLASKKVEINSAWIYILWLATFVLLVASLGLLVDWAYYDPLRELGVGSMFLALGILAVFLIGWALPAAIREARGSVPRRRNGRRGIAG